MSAIVLKILFFFLGFVVQALALKFSLGLLGQAKSENKFSKALGISLFLTVAMFVLGFVPLVGWALKPLMWLVIVMAAYKIGFFKSLGVAVLQALAQLALKWILTLVGLSALSAGLML
jgi:hypothetical protein